MKIFIFILTILFAMSSCSSNEASDDNNVQYRDIEFLLDGLETAQTRASALAETSLSEVFLADWDGSTYAQTKCLSREDFATPTISLPYGNHDVYFVGHCSGSSDYNANESTARFDEVKDTFVGSIHLDVNASTDTEQNVELDRCVYYLQFVAEDEVPMNAAIARIEVVGYYNTMCWLDGYARGSSFTLSRDIMIDPSAEVTSWGVYGFTREETDMVSASIAFYDDQLNELSRQSKDDVPVTRKYITNLKGNLFARKTPLTIMVDTSWEGEYDIEL